MGSVGSLDLPDLPRLFAGEEQIISWYDVRIYDCDDTIYSNQELQYWSDFLKNERVIVQLQRSTPSFESHDPAGAKRYETVTAAINVAPALDKHHNITQIKSDAEWLSKDLRINQIQALRVVLLEWQNRPHLHLQAGYSDAEIASLREIYGARLAFDADFQDAILRFRDEDEFTTETARRRRQLFIFGREWIGLTRVWLAVRDQHIAEKLSLPNDLNSDTDKCMELLVKQINAYAEGPDWQVIDEQTNYIWQIGTVYHIQYLMQVIIYLARVNESLSIECVNAWTITMANAQFLQTIDSSPLLPPDKLKQLRSLVSITSVAIIDPSNSISKLTNDPRQHWSYNTGLAANIHQLMFVAVDESCLQAVPAALSWALVLQRILRQNADEQSRRDASITGRGITSATDFSTGHRESIMGATEGNSYQEILDAITNATTHPNSVDFLLQNAIHTHEVMNILSTLGSDYTEDVLPIVRKATLKYLQEVIASAASELPEEDRYSEVVLVPQFALLEPPRSMLSSGLEYVTTCKTFISERNLMRVFNEASQRFPYEALPFLRLCSRLALACEFVPNGMQYITSRLQALEYFTQPAEGSFANYHTTREDENLNLVTLDEHTFAFPRTSFAAITQGFDRKDNLVIPAGTTGTVVSATEPPIICWGFQYSGLRLIGEWLDTHNKGQLHEIVSSEDVRDVVAELVLLVANLIVSTINDKQRGGQQAVDFILDEVSEPLQFGSGIVTLIFNIAEQELQSYKSRPNNLFNRSILISTLHFSRALLLARPFLFWQNIAKYSIIDTHGSSSLLWTVISGVEAFADDATLAELSSELYEEIILSSLHREVDQPSERQRRPEIRNNFLGSRDHIFENVVTSMTQNMIQIFESIDQWKEKRAPQRPKIIVNLCRSFSKILTYCHGVGQQSSVLTSCFNGAASAILLRLRPELLGDAKSGSILRHLLDAANLDESFSTSKADESCHDALFGLSDVLINAARSLEEPVSGFEICLFDLVPVILRKFYRLPFCSRIASTLLQSLLSVLPSRKPVSLLGHLGSHSAIDFINLINLTQSSPDHMAAEESWKLLTLLANKDQPWLSTVLLTGAIPERTGKQASPQQYVYRGRLYTDVAIDAVLNIGSLNVRTSMIKSVLHFMITAQQTLSWTSRNINSRQDIFLALAKYTAGIKTPSIEQQHLVALITDSISMYLYHVRTLQDQDLEKVFSPLIDWLTRNAIQVGSYNQSLHMQFSKNFTEKFRLHPDEFRINRQMNRNDNDVFDIKFANTVLDVSQSWGSTRASSLHTSTYCEEMNNVNKNLALVNAELTLLRSFQRFCIEHSMVFAQNEKIQKTILDIVQRCLLANTQKYPDEQIFDRLLQTRIDLALTLIQSFSKGNPKGSNGRILLRSAWDAALFHNSSYEQAIVNNDLKYWRSCLAVLLLTMQFHIGDKWQPVSKNPTTGELMKHNNGDVADAIQIATVVVGQGLASITSVLQEQKQAEMQQQEQSIKIDVGLKDLGFILNALESLLRFERLPEFISQLSERFIAMDAVQSSVKLYSWAHLLASVETDNDPVHAKLGILSLVALSSLPMVAEEIAVEGVLNSLLTSRVTQVLQKIPEGVWNLDQRPHCAMLYSIWSEGILPLCLNLLQSVGSPLASEISLFLNMFPEQLRRAGVAFQPRDYPFITIASAKEVSALSLISYILDHYRNAGASAAVDPTSIHHLFGFDEHKKAITADLKEHIDLEMASMKSKIVPITNKEAGWHVKDELAKQILGKLKDAHLCLVSSEELGSSTMDTDRPARKNAFVD